MQPLWKDTAPDSESSHSVASSRHRWIWRCCGHRTFWQIIHHALFSNPRNCHNHVAAHAHISNSRVQHHSLHFYAVGNDAPYGYIRNPMSKRNEIDPEAAFYVQLIFQWELMGVPIFEIARRMTLLQVPTPREWHRKIEGKEVLTCKKWGVTTIRHILENQTYAGDTINNKSTQKLFAGQDKHDLPKEQWYDEKAKKLDCLTDMPGILPDQYAWNLVYVDL